MPKRKLSELSDTARAEPSHQNRKLHIQTERLTEKFNHGGFTLFRALKTARGFERQKLGRRQKTAQAQGDNQALERIEKEIAALKVCFVLQRSHYTCIPPCFFEDTWPFPTHDDG